MNYKDKTADPGGHTDKSVGLRLLGLRVRI